MTDIASLLFANEAFYLVFRNRDLEGMEALWAERADVSCLHPGWDALTTRDAVMESWRSILGNANAPAVVCRDPKARIQGETGLVVCYEQLGGSVLVATNVFLRDGAGWRMVHHQAGPCQVTPEDFDEEPEPPRVQ